MKYFSMFSGIGGFELGIERSYSNRGTAKECSKDEESISSIDRSDGERRRSRTTCVGYSEINKYAIQTYRKHFPGHKNYGDATAIDTDRLPDFDLLCGGFPCQSFSIAGKRRGFDDTRGTLFFEIARILKAKKPPYLLLENVKGLLNHNKGETFRTIIQTLSELGYDVQWMVFNSKFFGVPQNRERVFIIGSLRGQPKPEILSFREPNKESHSVLPAERVQNRKKTRTNYVKYEDSKDSVDDYINSNNWQEYIYDSSFRKLTPIECERLQAFPDDWTAKGINEKGEEVDISDTQRYKMCGNAVTVNVIEAIIQRLEPYLYLKTA